MENPNSTPYSTIRTSKEVTSERTETEMKITELIKYLTELKDQLGNQEVLLSSDPEGNNFYTLDENYSFGQATKAQGYEQANNELILYPCTHKELE